MMKNQHRYDEISADRSIPKPHQPPHLLYFETLTFHDQKETLTLSSKLELVVFKFMKDNLTNLVMRTFPVVAAITLMQEWGILPIQVDLCRKCV